MPKPKQEKIVDPLAPEAKEEAKEEPTSQLPLDPKALDPKVVVEALKGIEVALHTLSGRVTKIEKQSASVKEYSRWGDFIRFAVEKLGCHTIGDGVRVCDPETVKLLLMGWNTQVSNLQGEIAQLDAALYAGEVDRYNYLSETLKKMGKAAACRLTTEYFEMRDMVDGKAARRLRIADLSAMLVLLLARQHGEEPPKALTDELGEMAKDFNRFGDKDEEHV